MGVCIPRYGDQKNVAKLPEDKAAHTFGFRPKLFGRHIPGKILGQHSRFLDKDPTDPTGTKCQSNFMLLNLAGILGANTFRRTFPQLYTKKYQKKTCDIVWASQLSMTHWWSGPLVIPGTRWRLGNRTRKSHDRNYRFSADHKGPWPQ